MYRAGVRVFLALALIAQPGCGVRGATLPPPTAAGAPAAADAVAEVRAVIAATAAPAVVSVREAVQAVVPVPAAPAVPAVSIAPAAVDLIIRWEVSGEAHYQRRLQHPIWPGGASGITWGIGYDGGHQTARDIRTAWAEHAEADRLAGTAGIAGAPARAALPGYADIAVPWLMARGVFAGRSLPAYRTAARRAFGGPFDALPLDAQGALLSLVYNRGGSMAGHRNAEKRAIRDDCLPAGDVGCIGAQLRAMCRLWAGTPNGAGLCGRREDEARLAEGAA